MSNASILIVEDNNIVMLELRSRLEETGYNVVGYAPSGFEAVKKAEEFHPDLIMMDIRLKGEMDGIDAAARIKNELDIPVIYLTAHTDDDTLQRAKFTEPYGYVIKPFEERELFSTIEMALYKHGMEKKLKESRHWLSTTLKSIGDALIATDSKGTVKIINHVAEDLTEWNYDEAYGREI
jgi:CheY-like chemotaxis protein